MYFLLDHGRLLLYSDENVQAFPGVNAHDFLGNEDYSIVNSGKYNLIYSDKAFNVLKDKKSVYFVDVIVML